MGTLPFHFLKYELNLPECLRLVKQQADGLLPGFAGQPARPTAGCKCLLDGMSCILGRNLYLR